MLFAAIHTNLAFDVTVSLLSNHPEGWPFSERETVEYH